MTNVVPRTRVLQHYVGGHAVDGESGRFGDVFDPSTGRVASQVPFASEQEVDRAVQEVGTAGAKNAAYLAAEILGLKYDEILKAYEKYRSKLQGDSQ